jgi:hypothetical protein
VCGAVCTGFASEEDTRAFLWAPLGADAAALQPACIPWALPHAPPAGRPQRGAATPPPPAADPGADSAPAQRADAFDAFAVQLRAAQGAAPSPAGSAAALRRALCQRALRSLWGAPRWRGRAGAVADILLARGGGGRVPPAGYGEGGVRAAP